MRLSELRTIYDCAEDNQEARNIVVSINQRLVSLTEIEDRDFFEYDGLYFSSEEYVITHDDGVHPIEDTFYCEGYDAYFPDQVSSVTVNIGSDQWTCSKAYVLYGCNISLWYYNGEYYDWDALDYRDLVVTEDTNEVMHRDNAYYHEGYGWCSEPDDNETYVRDYHEGSHHLKMFDHKSPYKIGFEIEKEDQDVKESIDIDEFEDATDNIWRKERDGSLDDVSGFEVISPTFEFNIPKIFKLIESNDILVEHINANTELTCGGHIHLSEDGLSGQEMFDKIKGYTPLLYALYYGRVDKHYCRGKKNDEIKGDGDKYQAIRILSDRIEFRIISAVPNVKTLKWRAKLIDMMLKYPTDDVAKAYYYVDTKFTRLLSEVYSADKLVEVKKRFVEFTKRFEDLDI
jgi:hypothetical protein